MALFTQEFINRVLDATDIVSLISQETALTKKGNRYTGLCPFHSEKTPSFSVNPEEKLYYCFGCHEGGNVLNFVESKYHYNFQESILFLAERAGITPEYQEGSASRNTDIYAKKKVYYEINKEAANFYYLNLLKNKKKLNYFLDRGITTSTIKTFGLGYAPESGHVLTDYLFSKGFAKEDMVALNLVSSTKETLDVFRGRVMFPIQDISNNVVGFGGRVLENGKQPKYLNTSDTSIFNKRKLLYNLNRAIKEKSDTLFLVEGYMDVVSLYDKGIRNACASLGTAFGEDHANLLMRHADNIIICYDGDEPGQKASERACSIFESVGITPKVVSLPVEHDPDTFVKQYGKEAFIEFSQKSPYSMDFKLKRLRKSYPDLNDVNAKSNYLNEACKLISGINDEFKQSYYEIKLATETGVGVTAIKNKIDNGATIDLTKDIDEFEAGIKDPMVDKELAILRFIIKNRRNYNIFKLAKGDGSLFSAERKELYDAVEEAYADDSLIDISKILAYNNTIAKYLAEVNVVESTELDENSLETYMDAVKIQQKKSELGNLKKQLETMKLSGDNAGYSDLLKKYNKIKKEQMELINRR